jgi:acetate kinase
MEAPRTVLALNSGSSSLKFGLYRVTSASTETLLSQTIAAPEPQAAIAKMADALAHAGMPPPDAVGHRIVHGGAKLRQHCLIDDNVSRDLEAAIAFAPLHMPPALSIIRFARDHYPQLPQVACFDTAFHADLPDVARVLPLPKAMRSEGIQRYGFHGLSCESIVRQLGNDLPDRLVVAHLGSGASVTAIKRGKSIDTSMGLTPTGGVIMGTRTGDIDPGVLVYLMRENKLDATGIEELIDRRSGLLGISDVDSDMRRLHEAAASNADARLAIQMFCYSVRKQIAAMAAALEGADLIVFTGGIGENDGDARERICAGLSWTGIDARVLPSEEDEQIARHTSALCEAT